ncbi:hypothetical protein NIES592_00900 [Fischerella major NIES-592]|uniref:Uncharacterized protein n=1 Tax=Fischerella major NIES-592 TaxID=210994 RepID=A0A1U7H4R9_9CYAN|nr:hypothetical protein NIES592_00900 [Fischerella major NIES-592]
MLKSLRQVKRTKLLLDSKDILPLCFVGLTAIGRWCDRFWLDDMVYLLCCKTDSQAHSHPKIHTNSFCRKRK